MTEDPLTSILRKDPRYPREAYHFVRDALQFTNESTGEARHVSARELLEGIRVLARQQFGPLAKWVLADWNIRTTDDFGNIVFNMIEAGEMGKTPQDDVSDFARAYDFAEVFPEQAEGVGIFRADDEDEEDLAGEEE